MSLLSFAATQLKCVCAGESMEREREVCVFSWPCWLTTAIGLFLISRCCIKINSLLLLLLLLCQGNSIILSCF
jgi:hypothetical protein